MINTPWEFHTDDQIDAFLGGVFESSNNTGSGFKREMTDYVNGFLSALLEKAKRKGIV